MITLRSEQCMRIKRTRPSQVNCVSGVVWVTQQGDLHDYILGPGDALRVGEGLTLLTALEPSVVQVERTGASQLLHRLGQLRKAARIWIERWTVRVGVRSRNVPVPYY